jgi:hypothetical protein
MKHLALIPLTAMLVAACHDATQSVGVDIPHGAALRLASMSHSGVDPFADAVAENGVNDQGQGFPDPTGILGALQVLDPAKFPPVVGVGTGGFVVVDMGLGEEILDGPGDDFMVIEADGSLLAAGFGYAEPFTVSVSNSPTGPFVTLGTTVGSGFFDLKSPGLTRARYVRLQDTGGSPPSGADLQGVVAFNVTGAEFKFIPHTINRRRRAESVIGHVRVPDGFEVASASIVLVTTLSQPSPTPPPFFTTLSIPGIPSKGGRVVTFDRAEFLDAAPDGNNVVVTVKLTSVSGELLHLFDLVSIQG